MLLDPCPDREYELAESILHCKQRAAGVTFEDCRRCGAAAKLKHIEEMLNENE